jgi:drug/metabolite transporter (DMT)-like permease
LFGAVMAVLFLGEKLEFFHIIGFATIIAGVVMTTKKPKTPAPSPVAHGED